jgi:hypothetical protein
MSESTPLSYRHQTRHILAAFFRSLENVNPWWISIVRPVKGDQSTTLSSLLGYEHEVGLEFLVGTGLLRRGNQSNASYAMVKKEWDMFIVENDLQDIMEGVNQTSVDHLKTLFGNYVNKGKLRHRPIDQFGTKALKKKQLYIIDYNKSSIGKSQRQCLLHAL